MASGSLIYVGNTAIVQLSGLRDNDGAYLNNAVCTMQSLVDESTGTAVTGVTVPVGMPWVTDSNGVYEGLIPSTAGIVAGGHYLATIRAVAFTGEIGEWVEHIRCRQRRA